MKLMNAGRIDDIIVKHVEKRFYAKYQGPFIGITSHVIEHVFDFKGPEAVLVHNYFSMRIRIEKFIDNYFNKKINVAMGRLILTEELIYSSKQAKQLTPHSK